MQRYDAWKTASPPEHDLLCTAYSPDGRRECTLPIDHSQPDHSEELTLERWVQLGLEDADAHGCKVGDWAPADGYPGEIERVVIARWPKRSDDFNESGERPNRAAQWLRQHQTPLEPFPIDDLGAQTILQYSPQPSN